MTALRNGRISHWMETSPRPSLTDAGASPPSASSTRASVPGTAPLPRDAQSLVIVGGGLTGLWAAYYASLEHPDWAITILEAHQVGYGASGRNGGWLSTLLPGNRAVYAQAVDARGGNGIQEVRTFQQAMFTTIDDVLDVLAAEGIDAHQSQGGNLKVAQTAAGMQRVTSTLADDLKYGYSPDDVRELSAAEARARITVDQAVGGLHYARTAAVDPALLTRGLASAVRARGVRICEDTRVSRIDRGVATTSRGPVRGRHILACLEAYSGTINGETPGLGPRAVIPVNSSMVATEPLPESTWEQIGWRDRECLNDAAHSFIYAQRTADDRIAIGGRGSPYAFRSGTPGAGDVDQQTVAQLTRRLQHLFPGHHLPIAHAWRGVIGVTRDWCAGVYYDATTGLGSARGYAGHGVTATQLAARTLLDRINGRTTLRTQLPWNDHDSGAWEPEPLRWLGVHAMYRLFGIADYWEESRGNTRTSFLARVGGRIAGL